ncbi:MAG TPA: glycine cleavage system aminomethyltransferase GcvT [Nitrospiria bacterium]|nr:glycine cleavage system aminomethyltransferase GcvT [Nitrospiria bacterium]
MKRTPLYEEHKKLGAKIIPFAGWEMPLSYTGVLEEHRATRSAAGLFDVSHMGRIEVTGPDAAALLDRVATSPVKKLAVGAMQYALACNEQGGILDDIMIYRFDERRYFVCANASNAEKINRWMGRQAADFSGVDVTDRSAESAQVAVQGPRSRDLMRPLTAADLDRLKLRHCLETKVAGVPMRLSRSGYTGELGYELYLPVDGAREVWEALLREGARYGLKPCGLGCRDTLRLEMGYPLYGNDMDETTTPIEASLEFAVDFAKDDFIGRATMVRQKKDGVSRRLVGFELLQRGVPRHGHTILSDGREVGVVTSGNHSPSLNRGIGMGYVQAPLAVPAGEIRIDIRGNVVPARVVERPFYKKRGTSVL